MKNILTLFFCPLFLASVAATAQSLDPFHDSLFEPDLVTSSKDKIGLTSQQEAQIREIYTRHSATFEEMKAAWSEAMRTLQGLLVKSTVNVQAVDDQFSKILSLEAEIKKIKLTALVAVKNVLNEKQQRLLNEIKSQTPQQPQAFEFSLGPSVDDGTSIVIRDSKKISIHDGDSPLYVFMVDGSDALPVKGRAAALKGVDPNDIKALAVLKGESAISKYGDEGKSGVIEIILKKSAEKRLPKDN